MREGHREDVEGLRDPWGDISQEELVARALRIALPIATNILQDRDRATDVAQDVGLSVLRGAHAVRDVSALDAWIYRIAVRTTMRAMKRSRARVRHEAQIDDLTDDLRLADPRHLGDRAEQRELTEALKHAIGQLPAKQQTALVLRYVNDLSYEQVAEAMGTSSGTVGALISRGLATLRKADVLEQFARNSETDSL